MTTSYKELFKKIENHKNIKIQKLKNQYIRDVISKIRRLNPGVTLAAAAAEFARINGFSIIRYLSPEDKISLQYIKKENPNKVQNKKSFIKLPSEKNMQFHFNLGKNITLEAKKMTKAYSIIYVYENLLRNLIIKILEKKYNKDWFKKIENINSSNKLSIKQLIYGRKQNEKNNPWISKRNKGDSNIYYTDLKDLYKIINNQWLFFKDIIKDQQKFRVQTDEMYLIRCVSNHNNPINDIDFKRIEIALNDLISMIKESKLKI